MKMRAIKAALMMMTTHSSIEKETSKLLVQEL
jgi:hypothetical protein